MYVSPIEKLIRAFKKLPGVGQRTAERYVFRLLKSGKGDVAELVNALNGLMENVRSCEICWDFADQSPCRICGETKRDTGTICVVKESQDIPVMEKTGYTGRYHVLRGVVQPGDEDSLKYLKVKELLVRAKKEGTKEIILALSPDMPGESTMLLIEKQLKHLNAKLKVTRLARGLPMGADLQYADEVTLGSALKHRIQN